jgi:hypothetical protein
MANKLPLYPVGFYRNVREEGFVYGIEVAVVVVGRDAALVTEEQLNVPPVHLRAVGLDRKQGVKPERCRAAREGRPEFSPRGNGVPYKSCE